MITGGKGYVELRRAKRDDRAVAGGRRPSL
jgi:hypothetical protein